MAAMGLDNQPGGPGAVCSPEKRIFVLPRKEFDEATGERRTRVGRPRGGMKIAARIGEGLRREIERLPLFPAARMTGAASELASSARDKVFACLPWDPVLHV